MSYETLNKAQLIAEIAKRRNEGREIAVSLPASNQVLADALDADDLAQAEEDPKEITSEDLANGAAARADGIMHREVPGDLGEYRGEYKYLATGEVFGLKVLDDNEVRAHKTHHAKSPLKFWDGTSAEFREQFEKL